MKCENCKNFEPKKEEDKLSIEEGKIMVGDSRAADISISIDNALMVYPDFTPIIFKGVNLTYIRFVKRK